MALGFDSSIKDPVAYMPGGKHQNVKLTDITFEKLKEDSPGKVLRFLFQDITGATFAHTEFEVQEDDSGRAAMFNISKKELYDRDSTFQAERIKHILCAFLPREQVVLPALEWEEAGAAILALAGKEYVGKKFRIKIILNKKDYTRFPNRAISPFIQNMDVRDTITISPKWDKVTPSMVAEELEESTLEETPSALPEW